MRTVRLLILLCYSVCVTAVTHFLQYFYTGSSGIPEFPEFVVVGMINDVPIIHYDSSSRRAEPTQDWIKKATEDDPQYWATEIQGFNNTQQTFRDDIETAKQRFSQTGGVHVVQLFYGCEWDDEYEDIRGFLQYGYDGEDFIVFDLKTQTWIAPKEQAVRTKLKWDHDDDLNMQTKKYLTEVCVGWLKKYVNYGRHSLKRTVLPSVSLLQRSSSSPVTCHATGFYPNRAELVWKKNGEELYEGVHKGEILPNNDGTFQMSVDLDFSAVTHEDWDRYSCVFQLSGVREDIITKLDKAGIRSNEGGSLSMIIPVVVAVVVLAAVAVIGFIIYKKRTEKWPPAPVEIHEAQLQMLPYY
ncbi:H-2 class I histocompatibility antigen, Q9 alpha chain-like [Archocentrus centrarchus]|uniref:H-2 class I histocompatibility antigen, Q9 alpha chain-like n=1 Tax=Archocentrus centrarchus TaxID=63155 RepID=UPI0011EA3FC1|nr:H-2 class I histocompatibility antigen, Q9 alpha chain-like [Archocentrus centrarchus]